MCIKAQKQERTWETAHSLVWERRDEIRVKHGYYMSSGLERKTLSKLPSSECPKEVTSISDVQD